MRTVLYGLSALLAVALAVQIYQGQTTRHASAIWAFAPTDLEELKGKAELVVEGTVIRIEKAPDIVLPTKAKGEPADDRIPQQIITIQVTSDDVKGKAPAREIKVQRTGGKNANGITLKVDGDEPYEVGDTVILFLQRQPEGPNWLVVSPEGRFDVLNNRVVPHGKAAFLTELRGLDRANFMGKAKAAAEKQQAKGDPDGKGGTTRPQPPPRAPEPPKED